ncbi:hypothetical protein SeMB42_g02962 [Synchytrium endobioticum]|uniref:Phospholipid/glycerol acyltransferase domain-containing protein n=1 Tax=Synchytrium endobioticum TaxID=286115 RepID=A0A507D5A3_9FUNG|nr:hypothetical protein SeLEV6574_g03133 [Synchytrium endobioticum]TPX48540.1 hypothetical protein SeMB42_g02962 [Synchytrium endobioticum]
MFKFFDQFLYVEHVVIARSCLLSVDCHLRTTTHLNLARQTRQLINVIHQSPYRIQMEKYSRWRDPSSGIHPMVPIIPLASNKSPIQTLSSIVKSYVLGPPLALVKLAAITLLVVVFGLFELLESLFVLVPIIHRTYARVIHFLLIRTILFLLGFFWVHTESVSIKKGARRRFKPKQLSIQSGDVIAANHTSYVDVLYLASRYAPLFVTPTQTPGQVTVETVWSAFSKSIRSPPLEQTGEPLSEVSRKARIAGRGPIVVFAEGTTSNGRGILRMTKVFEHLDPSKTKIHVIGLKYDYDDFAPTFTVGNFLTHVFVMACQWVNTLEVRYLIGEEADVQAKLPPNYTLSPDEGIIGTQVANLLNHATRLRQISSLGVKEKQEFIAYYLERERKARR